MCVCYSYSVLCTQGWKTKELDTFGGIILHSHSKSPTEFYLSTACISVRISVYFAIGILTGNRSFSHFLVLKDKMLNPLPVSQPHGKRPRLFIHVNSFLLIVCLIYRIVTVPNIPCFMWKKILCLCLTILGL